MEFDDVLYVSSKKLLDLLNRGMLGRHGMSEIAKSTV